MNHDYAHCADFNGSCPAGCFRAQLARDLERRTDLFYLPICYAHFGETSECKLKALKERIIANG